MHSRSPILKRNNSYKCLEEFLKSYQSLLLSSRREEKGEKRNKRLRKKSKRFLGEEMELGHLKEKIVEVLLGLCWQGL